MDFNFAYQGSALTPEAAVEVLTRTFAQTKVAASLGDPTMNVGGAVVPHVPMEAARNALIGAGVGGIGGLVSELGRDEKDRDYRRLLDKTMLGGMLGGGGTLAWRSLVNSGNKADPAALQGIYDGAVNPATPPVDPVLAAIDAKKQGLPPPAMPASGGADAEAPIGGLRAFGRGVAAHPATPAAIAEPIYNLTETTPGQAGAIGAGAVGGAAAGLGASSYAGTALRRLARMRPTPLPSGVGWKGKLLRGLAAGAGAYLGGHAGNAAHNTLPSLPGSE